MISEAQRKANRAHEERLKEAGGRKITVRLSPVAVSRLAVLKGRIGSSDKAVEAALLAYGEQPRKPVSSPADAGSPVKKGGEKRAGATKPLGWAADGSPIYKR